eukprot:768104-Hanusia_phi.AAC.11
MGIAGVSAMQLKEGDENGFAGGNMRSCWIAGASDRSARRTSSRRAAPTAGALAGASGDPAAAGKLVSDVLFASAALTARKASEV